MSKHIDVLLLLALPASGKSEARRYLASLSPEQCQEQFGIGHTVQLDDFPYVHIMRRVSDELTARGHEGAFFVSPRPAVPQSGRLADADRADQRGLRRSGSRKQADARVGVAVAVRPHRRGAGPRRRRSGHRHAARGAAPGDRRAHRGRSPQAAGRQGGRGARHPRGQDRGHRVRPRLRRRPDDAHPPSLRLRRQPGSAQPGDPGQGEHPLHLGHARGVPPQERRPHRPERSRQHPAPRRAAGGHVRRLRLRRHGVPAGDSPASPTPCRSTRTARPTSCRWAASTTGWTRPRSSARTKTSGRPRT